MNGHKNTKFQKLCELASKQTGVEVTYYVDEERANHLCEDDGNLHITKNHVHACFNVGNGQSLGPKEQNERTRAVMNAMGLSDKISDRVLVDETDDDVDGICPHCGR